MSRWIFVLSFFVSLAVFPPPARAAGEHAHEHEHEPAPVAAPARADAPAIAPQQVVVEVNGVVCSFCAQGVARALRKIPGLDAAQHKAGVRVDIEAQRVTLAFQKRVMFPLREIHERIRRGGYETRGFHLQLAGTLTAARAGEVERVLEGANGQRFALAVQDARAAALSEGAAQVLVQLKISPAAVLRAGTTRAHIARVL